ncbi:MAG: hypothetical protein AB2693_33835, partial [Candidatus Thiodiazotropha sp.]
MGSDLKSLQTKVGQTFAFLPQSSNKCSQPGYARDTSMETHAGTMDPSSTVSHQISETPDNLSRGSPVAISDVLTQHVNSASVEIGSAAELHAKSRVNQCSEEQTTIKRL